MFDRHDDTNNRFTSAVRLGLVLLGLFLMVMWLTTCKNQSDQSLGDNSASSSSLLSKSNESGSGSGSVMSQYEGRIEGLMGKVSTLQNERALLQEKINELGSNSSNLAVQSETKIVSLNKQISGLQVEVADLMGEKSELEEKLKTANDGQADVQVLTGDFEAQSASLNEKITGLSTQLDSISAENSSLQETLGEKTKLLEMATGELDSFKIKVSSADTYMQGMMEKYDGHIEKLNTANESLQTQIGEYSNQQSEITEKVSGLETQAVTLNEKITGLTGELDVLTGEKSRLETQLGEKSSELDSVKGDLDNLKSNMQSNDSSMQTLTQRYEGEIGDLKATNQSLQTQIGDLKATNQPLQTQVGDLKTTNQSLQTQIGDLTGKLSEGESKFTGMMAQLDSIVAEKSDLDKVLTEQTSQLDRVKGDLETLQANKQSSGSDIEALTQKYTGEIEELTNANKSLQTQVSDYIGQQSEGEGKIADLMSQLTGVSDKTSMLEEQISGINSLKAEAENQLSEVSQALDTTEAELDKSQQMFNSTKTQLQEKSAEVVALQARFDAMPKKDSPSIEANQLKGNLQKQLADAGLDNASVDVRGVNSVGILISSATLFGSGQSFISSQGQGVMSQLSNTLKEYENHDIRVEGHTDNVPVGGILKATFPSNWELSGARAAAAVRYLQEAGIAPGQLSAIGYGEFYPVDDNSTVEGRNANRRIEIVLTPRS